MIAEDADLLRLRAGFADPFFRRLAQIRERGQLTAMADAYLSSQAESVVVAPTATFTPAPAPTNPPTVQAEHPATDLQGREVGA